MAFKMKYKNLEEVVKQLKGAVKAHGKQAEIVQDTEVKLIMVLSYLVKKLLHIVMLEHTMVK